jgi:hypothetical protein
VNVEIESTDTAVKRCTQALIDCSATGCFIDIEWANLNDIPTHTLSKLIPVYNIDGTANDNCAITDTADMILHYENHSEHTQLAITCLGKQSLMGYNWLQNHNPVINWQTKDVKMSRCPLQCSTCKVKDKCDAKMQKLTMSQINACRSGAFPTMAEEDEDESPHVNMDETDEEAQDSCPAFDNDLDSGVNDFTIEEDDHIFIVMVHLVDPHHFVCASSRARALTWILQSLSNDPDRAEREMDAFLEKALATGCIRQSKSPLRAPVFFIKKKDGKLCFIQDYQALNAITRRNRYPLLLIDDLIHWLKDACYFTKLDVH